MTKIQTNALRIAELIMKSDWKIRNLRTLLILRYSSYAYLMPIVFECNNIFASNVSHEIEISRYFVRIHIADLNQSADVVPEIDSYSFDYNTEPEFIEAIQECVIRYLELKCQQLNIADNIE